MLWFRAVHIMVCMGRQGYSDRMMLDVVSRWKILYVQAIIALRNYVVLYLYTYEVLAEFHYFGMRS